MGMDLIAVKSKIPQDTNLHYNWAGWRWIVNHLEQWGVPMDEFSGLNDGDLISEATCIKAADALDAHWDELTPEEQEWLKNDSNSWRNCGGYQQY